MEVGTNFLKQIYKEKRECFKEQLQYPIVLEEDVRNKSWYRLIVRININFETNQGKEVVDVFGKYKKLLEEALNS